MQENIRSNNCLNCDHSLTKEDNYCPNCGQKNKPTKIFFKHLLLDFFGDYFTFDSKLFRSLKPLLFQPGRMTKEYLEGKRVKFIPPLRMFIFLTIIFILILSYDPVVKDLGPNKDLTGLLPADTSAALTDTISSDTLVTDKIRDSSRQDLDERLSLKDSSILNRGNIAFRLDEKYSMSTFSHLADKYPPDVVADSLAKGEGSFAKLVIRQSAKIYKSEGRDLIRFILGNGTLILLILIPVFAFVLKLLYIKRNELYATHFIFSLHFHSFALILFIMLQLIHIIFDIYPVWALYLILPVYMLFAIKKVYEQGWAKTALKEILLGITYFVVILPILFITTLFVSFLIF